MEKKRKEGRRKKRRKGNNLMMDRRTAACAGPWSRSPILIEVREVDVNEDVK